MNLRTPHVRPLANGKVRRASTVSTCLLLSCLGAALPTASVSAQSAPVPTAASDAKAEARRNQLINEGLRLRRKGNDRDALDKFEAALEWGRDARVVAQIALAEEALGRWAKSYRHLKEALAAVDHKWIASNRALLESELAKIEAEVGRLEVAVNVAGAEVTVDGEVVGSAPLSEPIISAPGTVVLSVNAPGFVPVTRPVAVAAGELSRADVALVPVAVAPKVEVVAEQPVAKPVAPPPVVERRNPLFLYVAGGGAVVALSSLGPWLRAGGLTDGIKSDCQDTDGCSVSTHSDTRKKVHRLDVTANTMLFSGLVVAAAGTAAYFFWPERERQPSVRASAWALPGHAGISATATFGGLK